MDRVCGMPDFISPQYWSPPPATPTRTPAETPRHDDDLTVSSLKPLHRRPQHLSSPPSTLHEGNVSNSGHAEPPQAARAAPPPPPVVSHTQPRRSALKSSATEVAAAAAATAAASASAGAGEGASGGGASAYHDLQRAAPATVEPQSSSGAAINNAHAPHIQATPVDLKNITDLSHEQVAAILAAHPSAAATEVDGFLPLHLLLQQPAPHRNDSVALALLQAFPAATKVQDKFCLLPLHHAIRHCSSAVIAAVVAVHPDAAGVRDNDHALPLHMMFRLRKNTDHAAVAVLLADPSALYKSSKRLDAQGAEGDESNDESSFNVDLEIFSLFMRCTRSDLGGDALCSHVLTFSSNPLYAALWLARSLRIFAVQQSSKDLVLVGEANVRAAEMEQLACAITRMLPMVLGSSLASLAGDECLRYAATRDLKFFVALPRCTRRIDALWNTAQHRGAAAIAGQQGVDDKRAATVPLAWRFWAYWLFYFVFMVCLLYIPQLQQDDPFHAPRTSKFELFMAFWLVTLIIDEVWNVVCVARNIKAGRADAMSLMVFHLQSTRFTFHEGTGQGFFVSACRGVGLYLLNVSNWYNLLTIITAAAAAILRAKQYASPNSASVDACNQVFAWAVGLLWGRAISILLTNHFVGPLLLMVINMLFNDLSRFVVLAFFVLMPFTAALCVLEASNPQFATFQDSTFSFLKIVFGQGPEFAELQASSVTILALGSVVLVVLLLNLLIALFSTTFTAILQDSTENYLLHKAQLKRFSAAVHLPRPHPAPSTPQRHRRGIHRCCVAARQGPCQCRRHARSFWLRRLSLPLGDTQAAQGVARRKIQKQFLSSREVRGTKAALS